MGINVGLEAEGRRVQGGSKAPVRTSSSYWGFFLATHILKKMTGL